MKAQRGVALLTVLLLLAMMTSIAVIAQRQWVDALRRASSQTFQQQAKWTLAGAEQWLLAKPEAWSQERQQTLLLEGETVHYRWYDNQACFNLNALTLSGRLDSNNVYWPTAAQRVFINLLTQHGLPIEKASAATHLITQELNPDNRRDAPPVLDEINPLRALPVFTPALWSALASQLCVLPDTRLQINLNGLDTRTLPLLNALLGAHTDLPALAKSLARRPAEGWLNVTDFLTDVPEVAAEAVSTLQSVAVFSSQERGLRLWILREHHLAAMYTRFTIKQGIPQVRYRHYGMSAE